MLTDAQVREFHGDVQAEIRKWDPMAATGHPMESLGGATWAPARDAATDYSRWGDWEAWEHCRIGQTERATVGPIPTGAWVAWNAVTKETLLGNRTDMPSRIQAETVATLFNKGMPTRIVFRDGTAEASAVDYHRESTLIANKLAAG
jgi:hypothetical protein